ncbi:MAG: transposase [Bdellovibrionales bacterium]|nr:transposase [Bdellovibrionales bacterium]
MPRKTLVVSDHLPYHVTVRGNNREPFPLDLTEVWTIFSRLVYSVAITHGFRFHAAVLMPNHIHIMISTPEKPLDTGMQTLISRLTREINQRTGRTGRIFGSRYHWSIIEKPFYFLNALKYVYRNPVRAKLCDRAEEYEFSTLGSLVGRGHLWIPITPPVGSNTVFPGGLLEGEILDWFNAPFRKEDEERLRSGFKRRIFNPRAKNWKRSLKSLAEDLA